MAEEKPTEESFLLSMLPFAGLALLLLLAVVWRYVPREEPPTPAPPEPPSAEEIAALNVSNFEQMPQREIEVSPADFSLGPKDAPVTLVEFSDFECPFCQRGAEEVRRILAKHPEDVRLVFKNFPIDMACNEGMERQLHPFACRAALLARCAGEPGFWQVHDALFGSTELSEDVLKRIPVELSLKKNKLESCMESPAPLLKIKQDIALARSLGVTGTPTFFINGRRAPEYQNGQLLRLVEHVLEGKSPTSPGSP